MNLHFFFYISSAVSESSGLYLRWRTQFFQEKNWPRGSFTSFVECNTASLLLPLLPLLDKDLLKLGERLVPRLGQGDQGEGSSKQEGAGVEEEYALDADQARQIGKCLVKDLQLNHNLTIFL